ncbi:Type II secretion system protein M [Sulfitobacter sp. THAF37]|uniref:type II secretion system protein GspM n=1 Tax=Sulfitobacter sp. THAF37 TaxID=2587855 RepID=UPI001268411A|nr:type II secretion system protein M [Sulfitobacter sp. THAF37]QFT58111.1 Type II secretion system protein M [Sulfitobacter sp. THAF37]
MKAGFEKLSAREQVLILTVLPLALVVATWHFAWKPLSATRDRLTNDIATYQLVADTAAMTVAVPDRPPSTDQTPIATRITDAAADAGLPLRRLEPEGNGMRISVDDVPFATVLLWLADLEATHGVIVTATEFNRRPEPGIVSARMLLETLN